MTTMFDRLVTLLEREQARFRIIRHPAAGTSASVAEIRGTRPEQGAKAMLCQVAGLPDRYVLAVLAGNRRLDFRKTGQAVGGKKASLAPPEEATQLTGCVMGAVPPFSFWPNVTLIADPRLLEENTEIAFNAGRLDVSMVLDAQDYRRIAAPTLCSISVD